MSPPGVLFCHAVWDNRPITEIVYQEVALVHRRRKEGTVVVSREAEP
jgi:hypothetical protein